MIYVANINHTFYLPYTEMESVHEKRHIFHTDGEEGGREVQAKLYFSACWEGLTSLGSRGWDHCWVLERWWPLRRLPFAPPHPPPLKFCFGCSCICNAFLQILPVSPQAGLRLILASLPKFHWLPSSLPSSFFLKTHLLYGSWDTMVSCFFFDLFSNIAFQILPSFSLFTATVSLFEHRSFSFSCCPK